MGKEALEKMAEPMLAGIYASDPELMSINSTFPMFVQTEQKYSFSYPGDAGAETSTDDSPG